jgi:broad specificity polyphosphatase/5'/3'-nucleotidase SurE
MVDDFQNSQFASSRDGHAFAPSSDASSVSSNWSTVQPLSEAGVDDDKMSALLADGQPVDMFSGLEETAVDSDDDDVCSIMTEVGSVTLCKVLHRCRKEK